MEVVNSDNDTLKKRNEERKRSRSRFIRQYWFKRIKLHDMYREVSVKRPVKEGN